MKKLFRLIIAMIFLALIVYIFRLRMQQQKGVEITHTTTSVVTQLQQIKRLETAQMTVTKLIEAEENLTDFIPSLGIDDMLQELLFQDKIVLEVEAVVTAGFDFESFSTGAVVINQDGSVSLNLPPAEILHTKLTENTKPFERELGLLTKGDVEMETEIRNAAMEMIRQDAVNAGILTMAEESAQKALQELFESVGVKIREVTVEQNID